MSTNDQEKGVGMKIYFRLLTYVRPYWLPFLLGIFGFILYASAQTGFAALMEYLIDAIGEEKEGTYIYGPLAVIGIAIVRGIGTFMGNFFTAYVARNIVHQLRIVMFDKLLQIPLDYFHNNSSGHILSKISYNVEQVTNAATDSLKVTVREGMTVIGLFGYLLYLNWQLTLVFIAVSPLIALVVMIASKRFRRLGHRIQDSMGDVTHVASENVQGVQIVRTFGGCEKERERFAQASGQNLRQSLKLAFTEGLSVPIVQIIVSSALALLIFLALHPMMNNDMTAGQFIAFIIAAGLIAKPLRALTEVNSAIQRGIAAAKSIFELVDESEEENTGSLVAKTDSGSSRLEFKDLCFSYLPNKPVLNRLSLNVEPGQTVALVGRSGSGKSTLASLIPRFYEPTSGAILLNGHKLDDYELISLRSQIALVTQNVFLFDGTIRDNIAYGADSDIGESEIVDAARAAHVMEFVERMPDGLDTHVGEKGTKLSGGQRQRIAIARAILRNAPVLILDEATSALDTESERHIQAALENVMKGRTTLVIAHRLSTIESADQIVVMDQGQIMEKGSHAELLEQGGMYADLYQKQFTEND